MNTKVRKPVLVKKTQTQQGQELRSPTPFEMKVYSAVRRIPKGQTRTYSWVAEQIGRPGASRAVGNALNRNPYAPEVPCHRVVRSNGALGGFANGSTAKRRLLQQDGVTVSLAGKVI